MLYVYEVELSVTKGGMVKTIIRREHAYSVQEGYMQGFVNARLEAGAMEDGSIVVQVLHIGPPRELIARYESELEKKLEELVRTHLTAPQPQPVARRRLR